MKIFNIYGKKGFIQSFKSESGFVQLTNSEQRNGNFVWGVRDQSDGTVSVHLECDPPQIGTDENGTLWIGKNSFMDSIKVLWPNPEPSNSELKVATELAEILQNLHPIYDDCLT